MKIVGAETWPLSEITGLQRFGYRLILEPEDGDDAMTAANLDDDQHEEADGGEG